MANIGREDSVAEFERVAALVRTGAVKNLDQTDQLRLYGIYSVATKGVPDDTVPVPSALNFRATAKYSAWKEAATLLKSPAVARRAYIRLVGELQEKKPSRDSGNSNDSGNTFAKAAPTGYDLGRTADGKDKIDICHFASLGDHKSVDYLLVQSGCDVNFTDEESLTPLMRAADRGHLHIVDILLQHGADTSRTDSDGSTALHYAALCGHAAVAGVLILNGAPTAAEDNDGNTPAQLADDATKHVMEAASKGEWKRPPKRGQGVVENAHIVGLIAVLGVIGILLSLFTSPSMPISISSWFKKK